MDLKSTKQHLCSVSQPSNVSCNLQEILDIIFGLLSAPDQVCLALTCKYLYDYFVSFLGIRGTKIKQLFTREKRPILCSNENIIKAETQSPRIQLLRRLEDSRWTFCSGCWNLHLQKLQRLRFFGLPAPAPWVKNKLRCYPINRKIQISPIWSIPPHGVNELKDFVRDTSLPEILEGCVQVHNFRREYFHEGLLFKPGYIPIYPYYNIFGDIHFNGPFVDENWVGHRCDFRGHPFATLTMHCNFRLGSFRLHVTSIYNFEIFVKDARDAQREHPNILTPWMSPQKNINRWLKRFFDEAGSDFDAWRFGNLSVSTNDYQISNGEEKYSFSVTNLQTLR